MTKLEKLIAKYKENPESISLKEMIKLLEHNGYLAVNAGGSHRIYKKEGVAEHILLAIHNNKLKYGYATRYKKNLYPDD